jgi:hypothetical protein
MVRFMTRWHPWRHLRDTYPEVTVSCEYHLPRGKMGAWTERGLYLHRGLDQDGRRAVLSHELAHRQRGTHCDPIHDPREEEACDDLASRWLITMDELVDALAWSRYEVGPEAAGSLWCDVHMLKVRVRNLSADERRHIDTELARRQP